MTMSGIFRESTEESERLVSELRLAICSELRRAAAKMNAKRSRRHAEPMANLVIVHALDRQPEDFGRTLGKSQIRNDQKPLRPLK
jgi:hypothetical protein